MILRCTSRSSIFAITDRFYPENSTTDGSHGRGIYRRVGSLTDTSTTARITLSSSLWGDDE